MKFYNREKELASLEKVRQVSFSVHSQMTVLTGHMARMFSKPIATHSA